MTPYLTGTGVLDGADFFLVDVGASGGIDALWRTAFGEALRAVGFDPLVAEVARLNAAAPSPKIRYVEGVVGHGRYDTLFPPALRADRLAVRSNQPFERTSAVRAQRVAGLDYAREHYNAGAEVVWSERRLELDEFFGPAERPAIDFVKVDTDGHDYPVLLGARDLLSAGGVLGLSVEVQFHGPVHEHANLFSQIDLLLRGHGFTLFDLDTYRYTRAALPGRFVYDIPAQTTTGQVLWGEAIYLRDLGDPGYERMWGRTFDDAKLVKLACLFELFGLPDCAAELLLKYPALAQAIDVERCLNALTAQVTGERTAFRDHGAAFDRDATARFAPGRPREPAG
jgi:hypothetical protein